MGQSLPFYDIMIVRDLDISVNLSLTSLHCYRHQYTIPSLRCLQNNVHFRIAAHST
jgi:hypothetical protein